MSVAETDAPAGPTGTYLSRRGVLIVFSGLMLVMLLAALDQTIVSAALPTIVGDLGGLSHLSWVVTSYLLATTVTTPIYGKLSDLYGRKSVFVVAIVVFLAGSALCGAAQSMAQLVLFRGLQGVGGGGLMVLAQATIADVVSPRERGRYMGLIGAVFGLSSVVGPLLGGFITDHFSWRWVFYVNLPVGAAALIVISTVLKSPKPDGRPRIDYLGSALMTGAIGALVLALSWGGNEYAWDSVMIVGLGVACVVLTVAFVFVERRAVEPVIPPRLVRMRTFNLSAAVSFIVGFAMFGAIIFLPTFLQVVTGASATNSGLLMLPLMGGLLAASIVSGQIVSRSGRYKWSPVLGAAIGAIGMFGLSTMDAGTTRVTSSLWMVVLGIGIGLTLQVVVLAVQNTVPVADVGTATSSVSFARSIGGSLGVAIMGAVFSNRLGTELAAHLPPAAINAIPHGGSVPPAAIEQLPPPVRDGVIQAYANALTPTFLYAVPLMVVAFFIALAYREVPLRAHGEHVEQDAALVRGVSGAAVGGIFPLPPRLKGWLEGATVVAAAVAASLLFVSTVSDNTNTATPGSVSTPNPTVVQPTLTSSPTATTDPDSAQDGSRDTSAPTDDQDQGTDDDAGPAPTGTEAAPPVGNPSSSRRPRPHPPRPHPSIKPRPRPHPTQTSTPTSTPSPTSTTAPTTSSSGRE